MIQRISSIADFHITFLVTRIGVGSNGESCNVTPGILVVSIPVLSFN